VSVGRNPIHTGISRLLRQPADWFEMTSNMPSLSFCEKRIAADSPRIVLATSTEQGPLTPFEQTTYYPNGACWIRAVACDPDHCPRDPASILVDPDDPKEEIFP